MSEDSTQGSESDALGRLGENNFETWCAALQWVANRATEDRRGFDFLVHVPFVEFSRSHLSRAEDVAARKEHLVAVQVKATRTGRTPRIKLSNLRYLAEHPGPSVIVVFEADSSNIPLELDRARLVHLDSTWVEDSVRRHWELDEGTSPNTVEVSIPTSKALLIDPPVALSFQSAFRSLGLSDPDTYSRDKIASRVAAGRPLRPFALDFTTKNDAEVMQEVADWSVGLRKSTRVPIERLAHFEERFGRRRLVQSIDSVDVDRVEIELKDSPGVKYSRPCWLDFMDSKTGKRVDMQGEIYSSHTRAPFLPIALERIRIISPGVEFLLPRDPKRHVDFRSEFSLPIDGTPLKDCIPLARLATFFEGGSDVEFRFAAERSAISLSRPGLKFSVDLPDVFTRVAHALIRAQRIALFSGIGDDFPVSMNEIDLQRDALHLIDGMPMRDQSSGTWMGIDLPSDFFEGEDRQPAVLHPFLVRLGDHRVVVIVAIEGQFDITPNGDGITLSTRRVRTRMAAACRLNPDRLISHGALDGAFQVAQDLLESEGYFVLRPSTAVVIRDWFPTSNSESEV